MEMLLKSAIVLFCVAMAGHCVGGLSTPPIIDRALNFVQGAPNAVTLCNNYTVTNVTFSQIRGNFYSQKITRVPNLDDISCGKASFQSLVGNNVGLNTWTYHLQGSFTYNYLYVAIKSGQFKAAQLPDFLYFITVNFVYVDTAIGYVVVSCEWDKCSPFPVQVEIATVERNPPVEHVNILMRAAEQAKLPTDDLMDVQQTGCPAEPEKGFANIIVELVLAILFNLIIEQLNLQN